MSNNDLYCHKCKSHHHPVECPLDTTPPKSPEQIAEKIHCQLYRNKGQQFEVAVIANAIRTERAEAERLRGALLAIECHGNANPLDRKIAREALHPESKEPK